MTEVNKKTAVAASAGAVSGSNVDVRTAGVESQLRRGESEDFRSFLTSKRPEFVELLGTLHRNAMWSGFLPGSAFRFEELSGVDNASFSGWLNRLEIMMRGGFASAGTSPDYVAYPASGYDAATVTSAFPDAGVHVMFNYDPFIDVDPANVRIDPSHFDVPVVQFEHDYGDAVAITGRVDRIARQAGGIMPAVLSSLRLANPDMQLIGVLFFMDAPTPGYRTDPKMRIASHGAILYRTAAEASLKMLLYLNAPVNDYDPPIRIHALEDANSNVPLPMGFVDAFMLKGSQGSLSPIRNGDPKTAFEEGVKLKNHIGRALLLDAVNANGGFVLEGMHSHKAHSERIHSASAWEIFPDEVFSDPELAPGDSWEQVLANPKFKLSYFRGMRLWRGGRGETSNRSEAVSSDGRARLPDDIIDSPVISERPSEPVELQVSDVVGEELRTPEGLEARAQAFREYRPPVREEPKVTVGRGRERRRGAGRRRGSSNNQAGFAGMPGVKAPPGGGNLLFKIQMGRGTVIRSPLARPKVK